MKIMLMLIIMGIICLMGMFGIIVYGNYNVSKVNNCYEETYFNGKLNCQSFVTCCKDYVQLSYCLNEIKGLECRE